MSKQERDEEPGPIAAEERAAIELAAERDLELTSGRVAGRTHEQVLEAARLVSRRKATILPVPSF